MARPEYPQCAMTPEVIRGVRERQEAYDANPAAYEEAQQRQAEEQKALEERQLQEYHEQQAQRFAAEFEASQKK